MTSVCLHQGVGSALVRYAVHQAAQMGVERVYFYTHPGREFYTKRGGLLAEDEYEGRPVAILMMTDAIYIVVATTFWEDFSFISYSVIK